jgi:hypothetical protein
MSALDTIRSTPIGDHDPRIGTPSLVGGIGLFLATGGLMAIGGIGGALLGLLIAGIWYRLGGIFAVAAGHVALGALGGGPLPALGPLLLTEAGLLIVLVEGEISDRHFEFLLAFALAASSAVTIVALSYTATASVAIAAVTLVGAILLGSYGMHRYQVVMTSAENADAESQPRGGTQ